MRRGKRKRRAAPFVFTLETLCLTEQALALFEQPLRRADRQNPKVALADHTIRQIKEKLALMKQSTGFTPLTSFDYNEKFLLTQALRAYSIVLLSLPVTSRQIRDIEQCQRIAAYFEADNARGEPKRPHL